MIQKVIGIYVFSSLRRKGHVRLKDVGDFFGVDFERIREIVKVYGRSFCYDVDRGRVGDGENEGYVSVKAREKLMKMCEEARMEGEEVCLSTVIKCVDQCLFKEVLGMNGINKEGDEWELEMRDGSVWFIPIEATRRKMESDLLGREDQIRKYIDGQGFYLLKIENDETSSNLTEIIDRLDAKKWNDTDDFTVDQRIITFKLTTSKDMLFIKSSKLQTCLAEYKSLSKEITHRLWLEQQDKDMVFNQQMEELLREKTFHKDILHHLLSTEFRKAITASFEQDIKQLKQQATFQINERISEELYIPVQLYMSSIEYTISDKTLHDNIQMFILDSLKTDILPKALTSLLTTSTPNSAIVLNEEEMCLAPPLIYSSELSKFSSSIPSFNTLSDLNSALKKLSRKLNLSTTENTAAVHVKVLKADLETLENTKRTSDVLQRVVWICLSSCTLFPNNKPAVFISGGKDTSRMIKLLKRIVQLNLDDGEVNITVGMDDVETIEKFRDDIKKGNRQMTGNEIDRVKDIAKKAFLSCNVSDI